MTHVLKLCFLGWCFGFSCLIILMSPVLAQEFDCLIEPTVVINIGTAVEGVIKDVPLDRGDSVRKGEVVARLESSLQEIAVKVAKARAETDAVIRTNRARVEFGTRRLARTKELYENEIGSLSELDEAETSKLLAELSLMESIDAERIAKLEFQQSLADLRLRTVRSPINGIVVERFLSPGELVARTPILKVAQMDPLRVEVFVPVMLYGKVRVGMMTKVKPEQPVGGSYSATVIVVDEVIDAASGTLGVRLELPNPGNRLPAGLKCKVRFPIS